MVMALAFTPEWRNVFNKPFFFSTQTEMDVKPVKQNKKSQFNSSVVWGVQSTCLKDLWNNRTPPIPQSVAANHTEVQLQVAG